MRLTEAHASILFVLRHDAATVRDVAYSLNVDAPWCRNRLTTLEKHGYVSRQYTGHWRNASFVYVVTKAGTAALSNFDDPDEVALEPGQCDLCGYREGRHMRTCVFSPERRRRSTSTTRPNTGSTHGGADYS